MFSRWCHKTCSASSNLFKFSNGGNTILGKISLYEPLLVSSSFLSPLGSVRTKRRLRLAQKPKLPELHLDKRFPFHYTFRQIPTFLTHPGDYDKTLGFLDKSKSRLYFEDAEELKTANEDLKRIFSLETGTRKDALAVKFDEIVKKVQRHRLDFNSEEIKIAKKTVALRNGFEKLSLKPHDKQLKVYVNNLVAQRNRLLRELQRKDEDRFKWLANLLEIDLPRHMLGVIEYKPTRKLEIARLTSEYCQKIRSDKINEYKSKLESEQGTFLKEKKKALEWIAEQEKMIAEKREQLNLEEELFWKKKDYR